MGLEGREEERRGEERVVEERGGAEEERKLIHAIRVFTKCEHMYSKITPTSFHNRKTTLSTHIHIYSSSLFFQPWLRPLPHIPSTHIPDILPIYHRHTTEFTLSQIYQITVTQDSQPSNSQQSAKISDAYTISHNDGLEFSPS